MFIFLAGMALSLCIHAFAHRNVDAAKVLVLGAGGYFAAYAFVSCIMVLLGIFKVGSCALITTLVLAVIFIVQLVLKRFEAPRIRYRWKEYLPLAIILLAAAFLSRGSVTGYYGTGQDEGLYQIRAMFYYNDKTDDRISFSEYNKIPLENKYERESYLDEVHDLIGYITDKELLEDKDYITGILHGLGVLPAMMALWGRLFGLERMNHVLMMCFFISIGNVWLICRNIKEEKKLYANIAALLTAVSPIVVWCGQNTLTEIVLTMFFTGWFAVLTSKNEDGVQFLSLFPLGGLCVLHILSTALIPMVVLIYWGMFFIRGKKSYLLTVMFALAEYALGFTMMKNCYGTYTDGNYKRLFDMTKELLNADNILTVVWVASLICMAVSLVFMMKGRREALHRLVRRAAESERAQNVCRIVMIVLLVLTTIAIISEFVKRTDRSYCYPRMTIIGYILMTGIVILPAAIAVLVVKAKELLIDRRFFALAFCFIYILWIYCKLLMPEVPVYFYFIRYLSPFIFLPIVIAGLYAYVIPGGVQIAAAVLISILTVFQSRVLYMGQDLTYCDYRLIQDITSCIGENDAVLINEQGYHCQRVFTFPIKALSGADVYYVRGSELQKQMERLDEEYESVFLVSIDTGGIVGQHIGWKPIYHGYAEGGTHENMNETLLPYPNKWEKMKTPIVMMVKE